MAPWRRASHRRSKQCDAVTSGGTDPHPPLPPVVEINSDFSTERNGKGLHAAVANAGIAVDELSGEKLKS